MARAGKRSITKAAGFRQIRREAGQRLSANNVCMAGNQSRTKMNATATVIVHAGHMLTGLDFANTSFRHKAC